MPRQLNDLDLDGNKIVSVSLDSTFLDTATPGVTLPSANDLIQFNGTNWSNTSFASFESSLNLNNLSGVLSENKGGTGESAYTTGDILYASATNNLSRLPAGADGKVLTLASGIPSWQVPALRSNKIPFYDSKNSVPFFETNSGTLVTVWNFIYAGSNIEGIIKKVKVVASSNGNNVKGRYQLFDITNNNIIADFTNVSALPNTLTIFNLGTVSNVPSTEAILEFRVARAVGNGNNNVRVSSLYLEF